MKSAIKILCRRPLTMMAILAFWFSTSAELTTAQSMQGQNAVCTTTGCGTPVGTSSFIDASVFGSSTTDICSVLNSILGGASYPSMGTVIDARGLPGTTGTNMTCAAGTTPWNTGSFVNVPSTILLPARTIVIPTTWVLPNETHLIGQGDNISTGTTIQAQKTGSGFSGTAMVHFAGPCPMPGCTAISVENLTLDAQGLAINGIVNSASQDFSYVDHVSLYQMLGTGLLVSGLANNSGPYSNITFDTGSFTPNSTTVCASINGTTGTRGIHGLTCTAESGEPAAAILLDSSNNSLSDIRIVGFFDGVRVGSNANAETNILTNVVGDTNRHLTLTPINTVHISNANTVTDLSILGASNSGLSGTATLQDDLTGVRLGDATIGIYAVGKSTNNGYARFTTSPNPLVPTWATGNGTPTGTCSKGSLYSCSGATSSSCGGFALYGCPSGTSWSGIR